MNAETTRSASGNNWSQSNVGTAGSGSGVQGRVDALKDKVGDALDRGRSNLADTTQTASTSLSDDMTRLREDIATIQKTLAKFTSDSSGEVLKTAQNVGSAVASQVGEVASEVAATAKEQAKTFASELENMARKNPLGTIGATLLAGIVIGMMSRGRA